MFRIALSLIVGLCLTPPLRSAPIPDGKEPNRLPTAEEIGQAVADLGSKRFAVRDKAKKFLLEAGQAAEPHLEAAARDSDEEIASAARSILERFQWGLYPNTPQPVRELIEKFRSGMPEEKEEAIAKLIALKDVPLVTLRKLIDHENDPDVRQGLVTRMYQQARQTLPRLLIKGDQSSAERILELVIDHAPSQAGPDYATFMYLRGKLDEAIARYQKRSEKKNAEGKNAFEMLVYLYRCKNDWPSARAAAEQAGKEDLIERVMWQSFDWKGLAAAAPMPEHGRAAWVGAAYDRLAGNQKASEEKIASIIKAAEDEQEDWVNMRLEVNALLLNGKANEAIKILVDKKRELALAFDLLSTQMKHKEAFDLVTEASRRDTDPKEQNEIDVRCARMLYLLGDRDSAVQKFQKVAAELKGPEQLSLGLRLVKAEMRVGGGLNDLALEHASRCLSVLGENLDAAQPIFEILFGDERQVAETWWYFLRKEAPGGRPEVLLSQVRDVLAAKIERKKLDDWLAKLSKFQPGKDENPTRESMALTEGCRHEAVAAAYKAIGDKNRTEEHLRRAAEAEYSVRRWLKLGDYLMQRQQYKRAADAYAQGVGHESAFADGGSGTENPPAALLVYLQARATGLAGDAAESKRLAALAHWLPLGDDVVRSELVGELSKHDCPEMARREADMMLATGWWSHYTYGNVLSYMARHAAKEKKLLDAADYYEKCLVGCLRTGASFVEPAAYLMVPEAVRMYRARGLLARGDIEKAMSEANANLAVMPGNIELAIKMVPALQQLGKTKEADSIYQSVRSAWEKLCKEYPESAYAHNSAAWVMANCQRDLDAALAHAEKAVKLEPKSAGYMDTLAEVTFRLGKRDEALVLMTKCTQIDPKSKYFVKQLARFKSQPFASPTPDEGDEESDD